MTDASQAIRLLTDSAAKRASATHVFALVDAARDTRVNDLVHRHPNEAHSLYQDDRATLLADVAPYLMQLTLGGRLLDILLRDGWGQSRGIYFTSEAEPASLCAHLRHLLRVDTAEGETLYFRFYDPRILRAFLPVCTPSEARKFFGPIQRIVVEGREGAAPCSFTRDTAGADCSNRATDRFILRQPHLDAFAHSAEETFIDRVVEHVESLFPSEARKHGRSGLQEIAEHGLKCAREVSLLSERAVAGYIELWFRYGIEFDRAPRLRELLDDGGLTEDEKLSQLEEAARGTARGQ